MIDNYNLGIQQESMVDKKNHKIIIFITDNRKTIYKNILIYI